MSQILPWVLTAILASALAVSHQHHEQRIDQLNAALGTSKTTSSEAQDSTSLPSLEERIAVLEKQLKLIKKGKAERTMARARRNPGGPQQLYGQASGQGVEGQGNDAVLNVLESDDPDVRARLADVIDDELYERRERRREERRELRLARNQAMVEALMNDYGVTDQQGAQLKQLLSDEQEQIRGFFQAARQDFSFGEARDKAQDLRQDTDEEAAELLDERGYSAWQEQRDAELQRTYGRSR